MPTYDYNCEKCRKTFEVFQSMKDDTLTVCPKDKCRKKRWGKGKVTRAIGMGAGLIFKGDGFYTTDYRSEGYKKSAKADKPSSGGDKKSDSKKKTDSKPKSAPAKSSVKNKS